MNKKISVVLAAAIGCAAIGLSACHPKESSAGQQMKEGAQQIGQGMKQAGSDAAQVASDSVITTKIKSKLAANQGLTTFQIHVKTEKGVVTLSGTVDSAEKKTIAGKIASDTDGVKAVNNDIDVGQS
ncbi:MAG: BON domain-containing protein [Gammaproteobacteria bacterium]